MTINSEHWRNLLKRDFGINNPFKNQSYQQTYEFYHQLFMRQTEEFQSVQKLSKQVLHHLFLKTFTYSEELQMEINLQGGVLFVDLLHKLCEQGKRKQIFLRENKYGDTPLHLAAMSDNPNAIKEILSYIDDKMVAYTVKNNVGITPMHWVCQSNNPPIIRELLKYTDDMNLACTAATDNQGNTPLHDAALAADPDSVKELLLHIEDKDAACTAVNNDCYSPLHMALQEDRVI